MKVNRKQLLTPAVLGYLFVGGGLPYLSVPLAEAIKRAWSIDDETLDHLHIAAVPTRIQNFFIAEECARRFGDLSTVEGFYRCKDLWWMDIDERLAGRGFLMPITHVKYGWIDRMVVFRNAQDKHGFPLKLRKELAAA